MNQSEKPKNRSTDGITLNKVLIFLSSTLITMCMGIITWVYTSDRTEFKDTIKGMAKDVQAIRIQQTVSYAHQENSDKRIENNERRLEDFENEFKNFYMEQRGYWNKDHNR